MDDLAVLILGNPRILVSQPALAAIVGAGGAVLVCDERRLPVGMLLPLAANITSRERIEAQIGASLPLCKQLWKHVVAAKIRNQAAVLGALHGSAMGLTALVRRVRSGDPANIEAQAARHYWSVLFGEGEFHRRPDGDGPNSMLNYAYAVLRALVARAICAAGLHPSIGIHHHNRYDSFALADDLIEPLRPVADMAVAEYVKEHGFDAALDKSSKRALGEVLHGCVVLDGERRTVADACGRMAASLAQVFLGQRRDVLLPALDLTSPEPEGDGDGPEENNP